MRVYIITMNTHATIGNMNTFSKQRKVNSVTIEIQQQQYFISSQLSPNPMAPQVAVPIEAGQENH